MAREHAETDAEHDHTEDPGDDAESRERSDPGCARSLLRLRGSPINPISVAPMYPPKTHAMTA